MSCYCSVDDAERDPMTASAAIDAGVLVAALTLLVRCWRTRSILAGVLGVAAPALGVLTAQFGPAGSLAASALAAALVLIGWVLYALGQIIWPVLAAADR